MARRDTSRDCPQTYLERPIAPRAASRQHQGMADEPELDWDERSALILALMRIEAKLDELLRLWEDDNGEEEDAHS